MNLSNFCSVTSPCGRKDITPLFLTSYHDPGTFLCTCSVLRVSVLERMETVALRLQSGVQERSELGKKPMEAVISNKNTYQAIKCEPVVQVEKHSGLTVALIRSIMGDIRSITALLLSSAKWAIPALSVPKPWTDQLRFTINFRVLNAMIMIIQIIMPHLDSHLHQFAESRCFTNLDFCHGFWQIPLAENSQKITSIITHVRIFSPTRTLQGGADSAC